MAKQELLDAFTRADLGVWIKKPMEQDQFELYENYEMSED